MEGLLTFENLSFSLVSLMPVRKVHKRAPGRGGFYSSTMRTRKASSTAHENSRYLQVMPVKQGNLVVVPDLIYYYISKLCAGDVLCYRIKLPR